MINKTLLDFVNEKLKRGLGKDIILKELLSQGWEKEEVKECFKELEKNSPYKKIKILVKIIIIILILVGLSWFIPIIPYRYLINCEGDCSNNIRTMTLNQYFSKDDVRKINYISD